jgi:feruloyl-CoA synthase
MVAQSVVLPVRNGIVESRPDGSVVVKNAAQLGSYPRCLTERLLHWASVAPDRTLLARRVRKHWRTVSYAAALSAARSIGQYLLDRDLTRPVLILSGNGIEHGLLSLACLHVGVPFVPLSTAYSLQSVDFTRLRDIVDLVRPSLVFADDATRYAAAIRACIPAETRVVVANGNLDRSVTRFEDLLNTLRTNAVEDAYRAIRGDTVAKLLFTSGSTGIPKGVIRTHGTLCSSLQVFSECYPVLTEEPPVLVDWLPWNHIFGGSISFGVTLYNGGTLYIDDGRPLPGVMANTIRNLREIAPTIYSSVPKSYEELVPRLRGDRALRLNFFSRLQVMQYSGASVSQRVFDSLNELALDTVGRRIPIVGVFGSTEASAMAAEQHVDAGSAGRVGLPLPGVTLKLAPTDGRLEARIQSPLVTPGYWQRDDLTTEAFDDEGFFRTGDALAWVDPADPLSGLRYDGRLAEDFKLDTATWVRVGSLRSHLLKHLAPEVRDVVIAGENRRYVAVLAIPSSPDSVGDIAVHKILRTKLTALANRATGSAQRVLRLAFLAEPLSIDAGEVTEKGSMNQRGILRRHAALVEELYADNPPNQVICADVAAVPTTDTGEARA